MRVEIVLFVHAWEGESLACEHMTSQTVTHSRPLVDLDRGEFCTLDVCECRAVDGGTGCAVAGSGME